MGFDSFYAAGHDRGARVLHRMCLDHPQKVARAAILDIIPQHYLYNNINKQWATFSWHWFFNIQPYDLPERMMGADPDWFIERKLAKTKQGLSFFDKDALAEYKRCFRNPATIHAICEDYRAAAGVDLEIDIEGLRGRPQNRMPRAFALGRDWWRRQTQQAGAGRNMEILCVEYRRREDCSVRTLFI